MSKYNRHLSQIAETLYFLSISSKFVSGREHLSVSWESLCVCLCGGGGGRFGLNSGEGSERPFRPLL